MEIFSETPDLNETDKQFRTINIKLVLISFVLKNIYLQPYLALLLVWTLCTKHLNIFKLHPWWDSK